MRCSWRVRDIADCGWDVSSRYGWDVVEWLERLTTNAEVATVQGSIPASSDTVDSEGCRCNFRRVNPLIYLYNFRLTKTPLDLLLQFQTNQNTLWFIVAVSDGLTHSLICRCSFRRTKTPFDLSLQCQTDQDTLWFIVGISDGEREPSAWRERAHRLSGRSASACTGKGWTSSHGGGKSRERGQTRRIRLSSPRSTIIPRVRRVSLKSLGLFFVL